MKIIQTALDSQKSILCALTFLLNRPNIFFPFICLILRKKTSAQQRCLYVSNRKGHKEKLNTHITQTIERLISLCINNCPTRCNTKQSSYYSASSFYMFRLSATPIIRSTQNCNSSLRYWSYFLCSCLRPTWPSQLGQRRKVAAQKI